jgi:hypothetical protein
MALTITEALWADHQEVRHLLKQIFSDPKSLPSLYPQVATALRRHDKAESETLYRALDEFGVEHGQIQRSLHEHAAIGSLLGDLDRISYADPRFFSGLRELVRRLEQHLSIEETAVFAAARTLLSLPRQQQLAERYEIKMGRGRLRNVSLSGDPVMRKRPWWHHFAGTLAIYHRG